MKQRLTLVFYLVLGFLIGYQFGTRANTLDGSFPTGSPSSSSSDLPELVSDFLSLKKPKLEKENPVKPKSEDKTIQKQSQEPLEKIKKTKALTNPIQSKPEIQLHQKNWKFIESQISQADSAHEWKPLLEKLKLDDLGVHLLKLQRLSESDLSNVQGKFSGSLHLEDGSPSLEVELYIEGQSENQQIIGEASIKLSKDGNLLSSGKSTGGLLILGKLENQSNAIFVQLNSDQYFQFYPASSSQYLIGNYYKRASGPGRFDKAGTAVLSRLYYKGLNILKK